MFNTNPSTISIPITFYGNITNSNSAQTQQITQPTIMQTNMQTQQTAMLQSQLQFQTTQMPQIQQQQQPTYVLEFSIQLYFVFFFFFSF